MVFGSDSNYHTHTQDVISADSLKTLMIAHLAEPSSRAHLLDVLIGMVTCLILRSSHFAVDEATVTVIHSL